MIYRRIFHTIKSAIGLVRPCRPLLSVCDKTIACADQTRPCGSIQRPAIVRSFGDIPTASQWPVIGNRLELLRTGWRNDFHEYIDRRHQQLGPIFRERLGPVEAVFIMAPDAIRELFLYEGKHPMHPLPEAWSLYNRVHRCQRGLFFMDGDEWLDTRRALMPLLFRNDRRFYAAVATMTDELVDEWASTATGNTFTPIDDVLTQLYRWSIHIIIGIMFGNAAKAIIHGQRQLIEHMAHSVHGVFDSTAPLTTIPPHLARRFNLKCWRTFEKNVTDSLAIANDVIEYGLRLGESDGLLRDMQAIQMSDDLIKRIFIDLILAAGDTTAFTTQWAFYALSRDVSLQHDIRQEIRQAGAGVCDTPLVKGCVREAMRLYPVATFVGRIIGTDATLNNYKLDKYTLVLISMYSAGRDSLSFPQADRFMPSRWLRNTATGHLDAVHRPQSSLPYALGARNCIGQKIANIQLHQIIAKVLHKFELKVLNEQAIRPIMRLVVVPSERLQLAVRRVD